MGKKRVCRTCKTAVPTGQDGLCNECRDNPPLEAEAPTPHRDRKQILAGVTAMLTEYILPEGNMTKVEIERPPIRDEEAEEKAGIGHVCWKSGPEIDIHIHIAIGRAEEKGAGDGR